MKKLLISLGAIAFAMNASATSALDQAKLNTVKKVYQTEALYNNSTPDLKELLGTIEYTQNGELCLIKGSPSGHIQSPPTFKIVNNKVNVTFIQEDHIKHPRYPTRVTLKYDLKCKNGTCLVSDIIDKNGKSLPKTILDEC